MNSRPSYSSHEVSLHDKSDDLWIIVDDKVFNLTNYMKEHPGGKKGSLTIYYSDAYQDPYCLFQNRIILLANRCIIKLVLLSMGGSNATKKYHKYHRPSTMAKYEDDLCIGVLKNDEAPSGKRVFRKFVTSMFRNWRFLGKLFHASILQTWTIPPNKSKAFLEVSSAMAHKQAGESNRSFALMSWSGYFHSFASACFLFQHAPGPCD